MEALLLLNEIMRIFYQQAHPTEETVERMSQQQGVDLHGSPNKARRVKALLCTTGIRWEMDNKPQCYSTSMTDVLNQRY